MTNSIVVKNAPGHQVAAHLHGMKESPAPRVIERQNFILRMAFFLTLVPGKVAAMCCWNCLQAQNAFHFL